MFTLVWKLKTYSGFLCKNKHMKRLMHVKLHDAGSNSEELQVRALDLAVII